MKINNDTVDIILPNYNKAEYLKEAVDSVINQTYKKWILYIIDDCSTDQSSEILNKYEKNDKINLIKLNIFPDGGISRIKIFGRADK